MSKKQKNKSRFLVGVGVGAMLVLLAIIYRCSGGHLGTSPGKEGKTTPVVNNTPDEPEAQKDLPPCSLRLDSAGLRLDNKPITLKAAITACKKPGKANLLITGGANSGERTKTEKALRAAGIQLFIDDRGTAPPQKDATP